MFGNIKLIIQELSKKCRITKTELQILDCHIHTFYHREKKIENRRGQLTNANVVWKSKASLRECFGTVY